MTTKTEMIKYITTNRTYNNSNLYKLYRYVNQLTSEEVYDVLINNPLLKVFQFKDFLSMQNSFLFLHKTFLQDYKEELYDIFKNIYLKRWNQQLKKNLFVKIIYKYKITVEERESLFKKAEEYMGKHPEQINYKFKNKVSKELTSLYKYQFSTSDNNYYQLTNKNLLTKHLILQVNEVPDEFRSVTDLLSRIYKIYKFYGNKKPNIEIGYISDAHLNKLKEKNKKLSKSQKFQNLLKKMYAYTEVDYHKFENAEEYDEYYANKSNTIHVYSESKFQDILNNYNSKDIVYKSIYSGKTNKTKKQIYNHILSFAPFPKFYINHLKNLLKKHQLLHDVIDIHKTHSTNRKEPSIFYDTIFFIKKYEGHIRVLQPNIIKKYLVNNISKIEEEYNYHMTSNSLFLSSNGLYRYLTGGVINKLFENKSLEDIKNIEQHLNNIYFYSSKSFRIFGSDKENRKNFKKEEFSLRKIVSKVVKSDTGINQKLANLVTDKVMNYAKGLEGSQSLLLFNEHYKYFEDWNFPQFIREMDNASLTELLATLETTIPFKDLASYIDKENNEQNLSTRIHDLLLPWITLTKSISKENWIKIMNQGYNFAKEISNLLLNLEHSMNYNTYANSFKIVTFDKINNLFQENINSNQIIKNIQLIYQNIEKEMASFILTFLSEQEINYLNEEIIKPIQRYSKYTSAVSLTSWLDADTILKLVNHKLVNPFPLFETTFSYDYIPKLLRKLLGERIKNIKGTLKNPGKLYNKLKEVIDPNYAVSNNLNNSEVNKILPILKQFSVDLSVEEINKYQLHARIEDKNTANYIVAGTASCCCMSINSDIMKDYIVENGFSIINIYFKDRVIANSLIWQHQFLPILVIDNIELHPNYKIYTNEVKLLLLEMVDKLALYLNMDLAVLGRTYNDINLSDVIKSFPSTLNQFLDSKWQTFGKNISTEDFYSDAEYCDIIWKNKSKTSQEIISNIENITEEIYGTKNVV